MKFNLAISACKINARRFRWNSSLDVIYTNSADNIIQIFVASYTGYECDGESINIWIHLGQRTRGTMYEKSSASNELTWVQSMI